MLCICPCTTGAALNSLQLMSAELHHSEEERESSTHETSTSASDAPQAAATTGMPARQSSMTHLRLETQNAPIHFRAASQARAAPKNATFHCTGKPA